MDIPFGSPALRAAFVVLPLGLIAQFVWAVHWSTIQSLGDRPAARRRALLAGLLSLAWMAITGLAAARGLLSMWAPPTMLPVIGGSAAIAIGVALSPLGRQIALGVPLAALVGFHGFRLVLELLMHRAYVEGLMPVQMSYSGRNFDIVTGGSALLLGGWLATGRRSLMLVAAWNVLGLALLANVLVVALLSAPTPFRAFTTEPANVWIARAPWVWLPAVMVLAALLGHVLVHRRLLAERVVQGTGRQVGARAT
jgi:hypothetical protein